MAAGALILLGGQSVVNGIQSALSGFGGGVIPGIQSIITGLGGTGGSGSGSGPGGSPSPPGTIPLTGPATLQNTGISWINQLSNIITGSGGLAQSVLGTAIPFNPLPTVTIFNNLLSGRNPFASPNPPTVSPSTVVGGRIGSNAVYRGPSTIVHTGLSGADHPTSPITTSPHLGPPTVNNRWGNRIR